MQGRGLGTAALETEVETFRGFVRRFSSCYGQDATQEEIYNNDVQPLLDVLYKGVVSTSSLGSCPSVNFGASAQRL